MRVGQLSMMKGASAGSGGDARNRGGLSRRAGMTGPREVFEGQRGMARLMLGECDWICWVAPFGDWRCRDVPQALPAAVHHPQRDRPCAGFATEHRLVAGDIEASPWKLSAGSSKTW